MSFRSSACVRRTLICTAYFALACRLAIPPGYMPASLEDGWPIKLCPAGLPDGLLSAEKGDHAQHQDNGLDEESAPAYCPVGSLAELSALLGDVFSTLAASQVQLYTTRLLEPPTVSTYPRFRSRAPPV